MVFGIGYLFLNRLSPPPPTPTHAQFYLHQPARLVTIKSMPKAAYLKYLSFLYPKASKKRIYFELMSIRIFFVWEISFPQLFSSHALFVFFVIYLLVLAWQSIIKLKLKLKLKQTIHPGPFIKTLTYNCKVFLPLVKKCPCSLLGRKFGEAILLAGTLFLFFFRLSFFLSFFPICAQHLFASSLLHNNPLRRHATLLRCVKTQRIVEDTKNGCEADYRQRTLTGNSSYFLQYLFKDTLIWLFSLFSSSPQKTYLKRFMITLDWLQIKLKLRKCWKEKNHGHRHEVDSSRIPPQRTWGTGDKVPRMSAWRATAMLL